MRRTLLLAFLIYGLILAGLLTIRGELVALSLPLVAYLLAGLWRMPSGIELEIRRELSAERVPPNAEVLMTVRVTNHGGRLEDLTLTDIMPSGIELVRGGARHVLRLKPGETAEWTVTMRAPRGYYPFSEVRARAADPFNLIEKSAVISTSGQLFVLPPVMRLRQVAIRPRQTRVYSGTIPARVGGTGVEFFGVREYQPGDSPHWINWHASARHDGLLFSNEFEQERVSDVGIVLDGRQRTNLIRRGESLFEHSVLAAAALTDAFISQGNRVSMLLYGNYLRWTLPGYGRVHRERILRSLAHAEIGDSEVFDDLAMIPTRLFPAHSQVVLISPLVPDDLEVLVALRAHGYQVMVISPDPVSAELSNLPAGGYYEQAGRVLRMEREVMLQKLDRAGIQLLNWNVEQPLDLAVQATLSRPPAWLRAVGRGGL